MSSNKIECKFITKKQKQLEKKNTLNPKSPLKLLNVMKDNMLQLKHTCIWQY